MNESNRRRWIVQLNYVNKIIIRVERISIDDFNGDQPGADVMSNKLVNSRLYASSWDSADLVNTQEEREACEIKKKKKLLAIKIGLSQ